MNNPDLDLKTNILLFIETKVNYKYLERQENFIPIEQISFTIREVWIKEWYALTPAQKKEFINENK
jgi:hypothetical protein